MSDEQDRYDLDEMMDRLKQRPNASSSEKGDIVTREDGSQVVKVRRRRRRSHQPHKERQRRFHMVQITAGLVLLLLIVLAVGFVTVYVNTSPYRKQVTQKLSVTTGADVELKQFRMNPTGVNIQGADFHWPSGNILDSLSVRMIRADVWPVAVLTGRLSGKELRAETAQLVLRQPAAGELRRELPAAPEVPPIHFDQCRIKNFQIELNAAELSVVRLTDSDATFMPRKGDKGSVLRMSGGDLRVRQWPLLRLHRAYIVFEPDQADVVGLSVKHPDDDRGQLEISGVLKPYSVDSSSDFQVTADSFLFSGLVGDGLGDVLLGWVDSAPDAGACELKLTVGDQGTSELDLRFQVAENEAFTIQNLPVLYGLAQALGDEWYVRPNFWAGVSGRLTRRGDRIELSEIDFRREDRIAIRGRLTQQAGSLEGRLEIGVPFAVLQAAGNRALDAMFGKPHEGFRWIEVNISGSATSPEDDFSEQYEKELSGLSQESTVKPSSPQGSSFEELTRPR